MLSSLSSSVFKPQHFQNRHFWRWLNVVFNRPDFDRIQKVGPNRACSEWLLKNGAGFSWIGGAELIKHYNQLSLMNYDGIIEKVVAEDSSISHEGFIHFAGCKHIKLVMFDNCEYVDDRAMEELKYLSESPLEHLAIVSCNSITDDGLHKIPPFQHLKSLVLDRLAGVDRILLCANDLQQKFPNTRLNINGKDWENNPKKAKE